MLRQEALRVFVLSLQRLDGVLHVMDLILDLRDELPELCDSGFWNRRELGEWCPDIRSERRRLLVKTCSFVRGWTRQSALTTR